MGNKLLYCVFVCAREQGLSEVNGWIRREANITRTIKLLELTVITHFHPFVLFASLRWLEVEEEKQESRKTLIFYYIHVFNSSFSARGGETLSGAFHETFIGLLAERKIFLVSLRKSSAKVTRSNYIAREKLVIFSC